MTQTTPRKDDRPTRFEEAIPSPSEGSPLLLGADPQSHVTLHPQGEIIARCIENHPGLTPEKAERMLRAFGF